MLPRASGYGSHGASRGRKSLLGWMSSGGSPDDDIVEHAPVLRERSRDLFMGVPLATGALKTLRANVVGPGLRMSPAIDGEALGLTPEQEDAWERQAEREWRLWAGSALCDAARTCTFAELQGLALLSALMSGDVFAVLPTIRRPGSIYDLRVQLIEADRICDPFPLRLDLDIFAGVEVGQYGEPVAYYVARYHPGAYGDASTHVMRYSGAAQRMANQEWKRVPAFGARSGRRNILHIYEQERPEQRRGIPVLSPVIESLKQLGRYSDAELMAAVVSGMLTVFVTSDVAPGLPGVIDAEDQVDADDLTSVELGNGSIVGLAPGEKVEPVNPARPNAGFEQFVLAVCTQIGSALEIPVEILTKHFTTSYTAARAAFVEFWKAIRTRRAWFAGRFCQPIYEEWLAEAVARGRLAAPGFFEDPAIRAAWSGAQWYGPAQGQINERVEVGAATDRVAGGFSTMARETAELTGESWERVNADRARELAKTAQPPAPTGGQSSEQETA